MADGTWPEGAVARIEIDLLEWMAARALLDGTHSWEDKPTGFVLLRSVGGTREWIATDTFALTRITGKPDSAEFEVLLPPRLVNLAPTLTDGTSPTELFLVELDDGGSALHLRGLGGDAFAPWRRRAFPDADSIFTAVEDRETDATVDAVTFATILRTIQWAPEPPAEGVHPQITFGSQDDGLWVTADWPDQGPTIVGINGPGTGRDLATTVNPDFLQTIINRFSGPIDVSFGADPGAPIHFRGDGIESVLMPIRSGLDSKRFDVETVVEEVFGPDALIRDEDGDYQLKTWGVPVWARLHDTDPVTLRVFATVAADIESSPELLSELNDINTSIGFAKVEWHNRIVTVSSDLVASTLDPEELFNAFVRVNSIADNTSALIVSMFGGRDLNRDAERWNDYLQTDIVAEIVPESYVYLNGERATTDWPFSESAWVITASNPHNLRRTDQQNHEANLELAVEIAKLNGRFCACAAEARNAEHVEVGYLIWNLPQESIVYLAQKFRQEAVFEITDDELRLLNLRTGDVTSAPRSA